MLGYYQDFGHPFNQATSALKMFLSSVFQFLFYAPISNHTKLIYFPLHVPTDMSLTIRNPEYVDQIALVKRIVNNLPKDYKLIIKEHPAMVGAIGFFKLLNLILRTKDVIFVNPKSNNYDVASIAELVITVNSKSGAEALILGKNVAVLGDAFYSNSKLVIKLDSPEKISHTIKNLHKNRSPNAFTDTQDFFAAVWQSTYKGELYDKDNLNVKSLSASLLKIVK